MSGQTDADKTELEVMVSLHQQKENSKNQAHSKMKKKMQIFDEWVGKV